MSRGGVQVQEVSGLVGVARLWLVLYPAPHRPVNAVWTCGVSAHCTTIEWPVYSVFALPVNVNCSSCSSLFERTNLLRWFVPRTQTRVLAPPVDGHYTETVTQDSHVRSSTGYAYVWASTLAYAA